MSGGHFNYDQYRIAEIAQGIRELIENNGSVEKDYWGQNFHWNFSPETIAEFKKGLYYLEMAKLYAHRIDWLVSGDDGEDTFHHLLGIGKEIIGEYDDSKN